MSHRKARGGQGLEQAARPELGLRRSRRRPDVPEEVPGSQGGRGSLKPRISRCAGGSGGAVGGRGTQCRLFMVARFISIAVATSLFAPSDVLTVNIYVQV